MSKLMSHIVKAQLKYLSQSDFISIFFIHVGTLLYAYLRDFNPTNLICFFIFVQYVSVVLINNSKENRDHIFALTTLSVKEIALSRIALVLLGFFTIYSTASLIRFLFYSPPKGFKGSYAELLMFGGLALSGVFFYIIMTDYFSVIRTKSSYTWFNIILGFIIAVIAFAAIITVETSYQNSIVSSIVLIVVIFCGSLVLSSISYFSYQKRESFLGYK